MLAKSDSDSPGDQKKMYDPPNIWTVLDTDIKMKSLKAGSDDEKEFPHAVLEIKWKSATKPDWVESLEKSHLVWPVPNFSLFAHSVAVFYPDALQSSPSWLKTLEEDVDIRKPVPIRPSMSRKGTSTGISSMNGLSQLPRNPSSILLNDNYQENNNDSKPVLRYWNEFDDLEEEGDEIFVIPEEETEFQVTAFNANHVDMLMKFSEKFIKSLSKFKVPCLGGGDSHGYTPLPRSASGPFNNSAEEDDSDDDDSSDNEYDSRENSRLLFSPRFKPRGTSEPNFEYESFPVENASRSRVAKRNNLLMVLYSGCFFVSALIICILYGVLIGDDMSEINYGTYVFMILGFLFSIGVGVLGMCLFLLRQMPVWWHQTLVFTVFFAIICFSVAGITFIFSY
jgi:hypothetical protein